MSLLQRFTSKSFRPVTILLVVAVWLTVVINSVLWRKIWGAVNGFDNGNYLFLASLPIFLLIWNFVFLWAFCWGRLLKVTLVLMLLLSASGSYFLSSFGIVIDTSMILNVIQTDTDEAFELVTPTFLVWMMLFGVIPAFIICTVRVTKLTWKRRFLERAVSVSVALSIAAVIIATQYQSYASLVRNNRDIRLVVVPSSIIGAAHSLTKQAFTSPKTFEKVGLDAQLSPETTQSDRKKLLVLVVGETARSMNFSLNGYKRATNPGLATRNVLSFPDVSSCGTATAISVPCLFQEVGRDKWKNEYSTRREGLLDVLQRSGVNVLWRDNNSGCKSACDRVATEDLSHATDSKLCNSDECFDEILLSGMQGYLDKLSANTSVIVLHMKGSHGPSYYKRYPSAFERFTPVCSTSQLDQCSDEAIRNAYDNTILYTDYVLSGLVDLLSANSDRFDSAMLYVSDHGESLGEKGVYLHGLPYAMAPKEQTQVPMLLWLGPQLAERRNISSSCMSKIKNEPMSHDNIYHSVLGLMGVKTSVYNRSLDMFSPCKIEG